MFLLQGNSIASESKDTEHQSLLWARYRGREKRRIERQLELTTNVPTKNLCKRKKRQGLGKREKVKIRGKERKCPFTSEKGT